MSNQKGKIEMKIINNNNNNNDDVTSKSKSK